MLCDVLSTHMVTLGVDMKEWWGWLQDVDLLQELSCATHWPLIDGCFLPVEVCTASLLAGQLGVSVELSCALHAGATEKDCSRRRLLYTMPFGMCTICMLAGQRIQPWSCPVQACWCYSLRRFRRCTPLSHVVYACWCMPACISLLAGQLGLGCGAVPGAEGQQAGRAPQQRDLQHPHERMPGA
jgi:hypothetical protein